MKIFKKISEVVLCTIVAVLFAFLSSISFTELFKHIEVKLVYQIFIYLFVFVIILFVFLILELTYVFKFNIKIWKYLINHRQSFWLLAFIMFVCCISIGNCGQNDDSALKDLINITWTIYGLNLALYTVWNAFILSKKTDNIIKPDSMVGLNRYNEKLKIYTTKYYLDSVIHNLILLVFSTIFLLLTTTNFYISSAYINHILIEILAIISFYLCTNSLGSFLIDTFVPLVLKKKIFTERIKDCNLDLDKKMFNECVAEEIQFQLAKIQVKDKDIDENSIIESIINTRNNLKEKDNSKDQ